MKSYKQELTLKIKGKRGEGSVSENCRPKGTIYNPSNSSTKLQTVKNVSYCGKTALYTPLFGRNKGKIVMSSDDEFKTKSNKQLLRPDEVFDFSNKTRNSPLRKLNRYKKF